MVFIVKTIAVTEGPLVIPSDTPEEKVSHITNHASMTALLSQLASLADYATLVFGRLITDTTSSFERFHKLSGRIGNLAQATKEVEKYMQTTTLDTMLSSTRAAFSSEPNVDDQLFTRGAIPEGVKHMYDKASHPPNLSILDPYMEGGGSALKLYTNPNFFIEEWIAEQLKIREEARKERKKRRAERKKQREEKKAQMKAREEQQVHVTQIQVAKYDPVTGEKILVPTQVRGGLGLMQGSFKGLGAQTPLDWGDDAPPPPPDEDYPLGPPPPDDFIPPPPDDIPLPPDDYGMPPPPPSIVDVVAPPPPVVSKPPPPIITSAPPPVPPPTGHLPTPSPVPPSVIPSAPQAPRSLSVATSVPPAIPSAPQAPQAPQAPPAPAPPLPIPDAPLPPPVAVGTATGSSLVSALANRGALKPTEQKAKPVDARSGLLEAIRTKNIALKSANDRKLAERAEDPSATSVAGILSRRIAIIGESSDESASGEEWSD